MIKYRTFLVITEPPRADGNVVPLPSARVRRVAAVRAAPSLVPRSAPPRETSWRDLVRRVTKNLAKR